jgi:hypothetical protein
VEIILRLDDQYSPALEAKTNDGLLPLHLAARAHAVESVEYLAAGADKRCKNGPTRGGSRSAFAATIRELGSVQLS